MPRKKNKSTERTRTGYEVPIPKRGEFFSNLKKGAKPEKGNGSGSARRSRKK